MSIEISKSDSDVYRFKLGKDVYTYRTQNTQLYSNEDFVNFLQHSSMTSGYYKEPSTIYNDYDGELVMFPRRKQEDKSFLSDVQLVLTHTKSEKLKQFINKCLNKCLIIDKQPVLKDAKFGYNYSNIKQLGKYHIDVYGLDKLHKNTISLAAHKIKARRGSESNKKEEIATL